MESYAWFIWSLGFLLLWCIFYIANPSTKKQILRMSLFTAPLGLTEPFELAFQHLLGHGLFICVNGYWDIHFPG